MPKLTAIRKQALDEVMKNALFEATVAVLSKHGVDGMTMDRVAAEAGVAKGSLYRYFRAKRDLLEFVYTKTTEPILQDMDAILATEQPAVEKLARHVRTLLDHVARHVQIFRMLFENDTAHGLLQSTERSTREAASQRLAEMFRQGMAEGVFRPANPLQLANVFLGLCKGVFDSRPGLEGPEQREDVHRLIMDMLLHGIAAQASPANDGDAGLPRS